jgi:hypothetical protein
MMAALSLNAKCMLDSRAASGIGPPAERGNGAQMRKNLKK